jgi:hypothetical protein
LQDVGIEINDPRWIPWLREEDDDMFGQPTARNVHDLSSEGDSEVYDITQYEDNIHSGDILQLSRGRWAIMVDAYPVMVVGHSEVLHHLNPGTTFETFEGGEFAAAAGKAIMLARRQRALDRED